MTTADRIHFECPSCGLVLDLPRGTKRLVCRCDFDTAGRRVAAQAVDETHFTWSRIRACEACSEYMGGERCKLVEMGCRNSFWTLLSDAAGQCPQSLWADAADRH
jgi:hypothetical protein